MVESPTPTGIVPRGGGRKIGWVCTPSEIAEWHSTPGACAPRILPMDSDNSIGIASNSTKPGRDLGRVLPRRKSGPRPLMTPEGCAWELAAVYRNVKRGKIDSTEGCRRAMILSSLGRVLDQIAQRDFEKRLIALEQMLNRNGGALVPSVRDLVTAQRVVS